MESRYFPDESNGILHKMSIFTLKSNDFVDEKNRIVNQLRNWKRSLKKKSPGGILTGLFHKPS